MPLLFQCVSPPSDLRPAGGIRDVILSDTVLQTVAFYRQIRRRNEAGGILLGRLWPDRLVVEQASKPGHGDRAGRCSFERHAVRAQGIVNAAWHDSGGELNYVGEWHTHAEDYPKPSSVDRRMIRAMFEGAQLHHGWLLLLIVGRQDLWLGRQDAVGLSQSQVVTKATPSGCTPR